MEKLVVGCRAFVSERLARFRIGVAFNGADDGDPSAVADARSIGADGYVVQ